MKGRPELQFSWAGDLQIEDFSPVDAAGTHLRTNTEPLLPNALGTHRSPFFFIHRHIILEKQGGADHLKD